MSPLFGKVHREDDRGVATLWLDRGKHNQLDAALLHTLGDALAACGSDPSVRAVVVTGAGPSFSVGADLSNGPSSVRDLLTGEGAYAGDYREPAGRVSVRIAKLGVPVIAAVNGDAIGGGATILLAADVRFTAESARFGFPFTRLGLSPEGASTYFLPRLVGPSRAADWLLSGRLIDAREALAAGLVSRVLPDDDFYPRLRSTPASSSNTPRGRRSRRRARCSPRTWRARKTRPARKAARSRGSPPRRTAWKASERSWNAVRPASAARTRPRRRPVPRRPSAGRAAHV